MSKEFKRENRYLVLKRTDIHNALSPLERDILFSIADKVHTCRTKVLEKPELCCVVVESDWPEYETVWQMIQDRMEGISTPPTYEHGAREMQERCVRLAESFELGEDEFDKPVLLGKGFGFVEAVRALPLKEEAAKVCEWGAHYQRGYSVVQDTQCGELHAQPGARGFKFCPYCGKPIKIKEGGE